jgi:hypothetical protein
MDRNEYTQCPKEKHINTLNVFKVTDVQNFHHHQQHAADWQMFCIAANGRAAHEILISHLGSCSVHGFEM